MKTKIRKIDCDADDLIARMDCGCYAREGYNAGDPPYLVHCNLHGAAPDLVRQLKSILKEFVGLYEQFDPTGEIAVWDEWRMEAEKTIDTAEAQS